MLTLTTDVAGSVTERGFDGPEAAHDYVKEHRLIARLMAALGLTVWVWVLEFQSNGNPHWHVVYDASGLPGFRLDYARLHALWRDRYGVGLAKDSGLGFKCDGRFALMYITKYLTKQPREGYPAWVVLRSHRGCERSIRFVGASAAVGRLVMPDEVAEGVTDAEPQLEDEAEVMERSRQFRWSTYYEDVRACGSRSRVFRRTVADDGTERLEFLAELPVSPGHLVGDADCERLCASAGFQVDAVQEFRELRDGSGWPFWHVEAFGPDVDEHVLLGLARRLEALRATWSESYAQRFPVACAVGADTSWTTLPPLQVFASLVLSNPSDVGPVEAEGGTSHNVGNGGGHGSWNTSGVPPQAISDV